MPNIYTIPWKNHFNFIEAREVLVEDILIWANTLDSNTEFVDRLPALLLNFYFKIVKFRDDYTGTSGISGCFFTRCQVLRESTKGAKLFFEAECLPKREMVMMLKWIGIQIGRLRLNQIFGADNPADRRDEEAAEIDKIWNPSARYGLLSGIGLWSSSPLLSSIWLALHCPVSGCLCVQCISFREDFGT